MALAGITLVANGTELKYPYEVCIRNLLSCCDKVFVNTDTENCDDTLSRLKTFGERVVVIETAWDWSVTNGTDLAYRANQCADVAMDYGYTDVLYVQADEIIHPNEIIKIRRHPAIVDRGPCNFELERTYFWKDLDHINSTWTVPIVRMGVLDREFRVLGDGMYTKFTRRVPTHSVPRDYARIYHYSRVGPSKDIARRLNCLDSLFHDEGTYTPLDDYVFGRNNNFETEADQANVTFVGNDIITHPPGIEAFYSEDFFAGCFS